jgi:streptogrisin C
VCSNRYACGRPLRSGINVGPVDGRIGRARDYCSLGFTAAATDGSKWAVTAAHCMQFAIDEGLGTIWGHGEQVIGQIRHPRWDDECRFIGYNATNCKIDVARILVQNSYWTTGGYFYTATALNNPLPVDGAVTRPEQIQVGDTMCLSARHSGDGNVCGTITFPGSASRMAKVSKDGCNGDSGGGWYHKTAAGTRIAYGIHDASDDDGCHVGGSQSYFSTLPNINYWWDHTTAATLRVETR